MTAALAMLVALGVEAIFGWPDAVYRRIGHPVTWIGNLIARLDAGMNDDRLSVPARRRAGLRATVIVVGTAAGIAFVIAILLPEGLTGAVITGMIAAPLVASRSLHDHVVAVAVPLSERDIVGARKAVSMIVGRDPAQLDAQGTARAALESLAENASDGIVAPVFWGVLLGLPGIAAYKAVNTLDSMIGHRNERYLDFGRFAARLDDAVNWLPARLTAIGFALASGRPGQVIPIVRRDAPRHRSPNAGWPETAMAAGLGCRLSGPRSYGQGVEDQPWLNIGAPDPEPASLYLGLALYRRMLMLLAAVLVAAALV